MKSFRKTEGGKARLWLLADRQDKYTERYWTTAFKAIVKVLKGSSKLVNVAERRGRQRDAGKLEGLVSA